MDAGTIACPVLVYSRSREQCPIYEEYVVFWISVKSDAMPKHVLFLLILFLSPLSYLVPGYATAPALMYVGLLMLSNVAKIDFADFVDAMAGLVTAVFIVLTCNIVTGIMIGFATLVIGRLVSGEWRKLNIGTVVIAVALVTFYAGGWAI